MKKSIIIIVAALALAACSNSNDIKSEEFDVELVVGKALIRESIYDDFSKKAVLNLCKKESYRQCFSIDSSQCIDDLLFLNDKCIDVMRHEQLIEKSSREIYMEAFSFCYAIEHMNQYISGDNFEEMTNCLEESAKNN